MDTGSNIRKIRELKNITQEFIANELGISTRAYSKIETSETQLSVNRLFEISKIINVPVNEILDFDTNLIFNNNPVNQKGGKYIAYNNTEIKQMQDLYEKLIQEKDKRIDLLESQLKNNL